MTLYDLSYTVVRMTNHSLNRTVAAATGAKVRGALAEADQTATRLAQVLNLGAHAVGRRLRGDVSFTVVELIATARWLGLEPQALLPQGLAESKRSA